MDRDAGVTQGVCTAQPAVFSQVVCMRERKEQACSVGIPAYFALEFLIPLFMRETCYLPKVL